MWFWWFVLACDLFIPIAMFVGGWLMLKHCPKEINGLLGYRTARSMKNMDTWRFAHKFCGKLWLKVGLIMLFPTILLHLPFYNSDEDTLGLVSIVFMIIQLVVLIASAFPTEIALKKTFNDDGTRR